MNNFHLTLERKLRNAFGFTLVELLIVVAIIAILTVIGIVNYSSFIKSSRDAKRQSDLKMIQSALEAYHADQIAYPALITFGGQLAVGSKTYLTKVPIDPKNGHKPYIYSLYPSGCTGSNCTGYCLYAKLESLSTNQFEYHCNSPGDSEYNFSVTRP